MRDRTIALTACIQHAWWAHRLAQHGEFRIDRLNYAVTNILCTDPDELMDVYGSVNDLKSGIQIARILLSKNASQDINRAEVALITGYVGQLIKISSRLLSSQAAIHELAEHLKKISAEIINTEDPPVSKIAQAYMETISPIAPRIMIQGNGIYLQNDEFAAGIRTHLLAAVRSAVLWRQCGGKLWHFIFQRNTYLMEINKLQQEVHE